VEEALQTFKDVEPNSFPSSNDQDSKAALVQMFHSAFLHKNALNALVFPSLRKFETETVAMVAHMLSGSPDCVGNITSGGTESILVAVKTYRDRARKLFPSITDPEIVRGLKYHSCIYMNLL